MELYGYIAAIFMGLSLGLIGGGGSILTVPILVYMFSVKPLIATSSSLFIVGSTALAGAVLAHKRKQVDFKTGLQFAVPSFVGVFVTKSLILPLIPEQIFSAFGVSVTKGLLVMGFFAILMVLASSAMIRQKKNKPFDHVISQKHRGRAISSQGLLVGGVTGFVGAGGGFLIVPALVNLLGLSMRTAVGTSLMIIAANSLFGFGVSIAKGLVVEWFLLLSILAMALLGLFVGSFWSKKVSDQKLKMGFGYFILIMGALILLDQMHRL